MKKEKKTSPDQIKALLLSKHIFPSFQRITIFDFLSKNKKHQRVDAIYNALINGMPTLSKTTVYNTLKSFEEKGLVKKLTLNEAEARYDIDTSFHHHFKCRKCGRIFDIEQKTNTAHPSIINGHKVENEEIYFYGICRDCKKERS